MKKLLLASVAILAAQAGFAASQEPTSCPTVASIQNIGVSSAWQDTEKGTWVGVEWKNSFNTDFDWTFGIGEFYSDKGDAKDVIEQANKALPNLTAASAPMKGRDEKGNLVWVCYYSGVRGIYGMAITPAIQPQFIIKTMKSIRR
ncbi:MAG TPA: hypothetical protein VL360_01925 [Gammaproteobacteria bacterium]|jgi:hypothetical protein|nr:hypothetical protein [Gammaproteobacteria bacterium]